MKKKVKIDPAALDAAIAWVSEFSVLGESATAACLELLAKGTIETKGGSHGARLCFEMSKPERGLVRIVEQRALKTAPLGKVEISSWAVTDLGREVEASIRKKSRKAEIREAARKSA